MAFIPAEKSGLHPLLWPRKEWQFIRHQSQIGDKKKKKRRKIEFWAGKELSWQILNLCIHFFQFIWKGALLARNKVLNAKANTIWADAESSDCNEAVIMSIFPRVFVLFYLSSCISFHLQSRLPSHSAAVHIFHISCFFSVFCLTCFYLHGCPSLIFLSKQSNL